MFVRQDESKIRYSKLINVASSDDGKESEEPNPEINPEVPEFTAVAAAVALIGAAVIINRKRRMEG